MPVLRVVLLTLAVAAAGAVAVPLAMPSLLFQLEVPGMAADAHAGHAGHTGATPRAGAPHAHGAAAGSPGHDHAAADPDGDGPHSAHGDGAATADGAGHAGHAQTPAGDHAHDGVGMQRPHFPPSQGTVPSSPDRLRRMDSLFIEGDSPLADLDIPGHGTLEDPYVFHGLYFPRELNLLDTDACIEVSGSWIAGQLSLNWNGQCVWAHHNHIADLRVNENIPRVGYATGGLIEANEIGIVGQLRHYDGEFRDNVVGPAPPDALFDTVLETVPYFFAKDTRVANIDGFNQGLIHHNTFLGSVDLDFHGHHHGTGFFAPHSHYHGDSDARMAEHQHDHTDRWTSVSFTDNLVVDREGYGLRYEDENHAGDDRTASSETTDALREKHVHHTDIVLARNTIDGGHLWVDVFNADDVNHKARNPGTLTIEGNAVTTREPAPDDAPCSALFGHWYDSRTTMHIHTIKEVETIVRGNTLTYIARPSPSDTLGSLQQVARDCVLWSHREDAAAIRLEGVRDASILVEGNVAEGTVVGIDARDMDRGTTWRVVGNQFPGKAIRADDTVANPPETS
ncbi:MAG TPA: hypothetical protein VM327_09000 [Candidatus Thermoplasmatota archaeon]|nr:hypothetical protein [Candidatus Thermoplasmatota archaeon]